MNLIPDVRRWSFARLIVSFLLWIITVVLLFIGDVAMPIFIETRSAGSSGIGAVTFGIDGPLALAVRFGPPLVVTVLWIVKRRSPAPPSA